MPLATIEEALNDLRRGRFVVVVDDDDRENEGDLIMPAEYVTPEAVNFMAKYGRGLVCAPMTGERLDQLRIPMMVTHNSSRTGTPFTVTVEAREGTTTGISAADRARTIAVLADPRSNPDDLIMPGHIFPLRAVDGGVLERAGHTEATVDLARLVTGNPVGVLCEVMNDDGTMARLPDLERFCDLHDLKLIAISDLIAYRRRYEIMMRRVAEAKLPTAWGEFRVIAFEHKLTEAEHICLVKGNVATNEPVLVRVHSECLTGDVFHSLRCDCGKQLELALANIAEAERGVVVYLRQEGRGIGLVNKLRAYSLQDNGLDTVEANVHLGFAPDSREYSLAAHMLKELGVSRLRLLTNNPRKMDALAEHGLEVVERLPVRVTPQSFNSRYLATKREKLGHLL